MPKRLTTEIFIERAKKVHGDKYNYSKVRYVNSDTKVCIICPKHGEFWQRPHHHLNGVGCWDCSYDARALLRRKPYVEFISEAKDIHGDKYDYSKVSYKNNKEPVEIICPIHGSFWQIPKDHLNGHGCPRCSSNFKIAYDVFIIEARKIHGNKYDYSNVIFDNVFSKISIVCPKHGIFEQELHSHLRGRGCFKCGIEKSFDTKKKNGTCSSSMMSDDLFYLLCDFFGEDDVYFEYNKDVRYPFHCDFYIKSKDLFIELNGFWTHGGHWFDENNIDDIVMLNGWKCKNTDFYNNAIETWTVRDVKKREYARKNNLNYVVFWGDCRDEIDEWFKVGCPVRKDWK